MPSQLIENDNVTFLCARDFVWAGVEYKMGDEFDQTVDVGRIELLVRTRRVIPVVEDSSVKPRHWHREVRVRSDIERRLGVSRDVVTALDQSPPSEGTSTTDSDEFDPAGHTIPEILDYVEDYPDEVTSVYELEEKGKNRSTLLGQLDEIINETVKENEDD